jgi:hypothetical protein
MSREILSVAVYEPLPGREQDSLETMGLLLKVLSAAGFSRDFSLQGQSPVCASALLEIGRGTPGGV